MAKKINKNGQKGENQAKNEEKFTKFNKKMAKKWTRQQLKKIPYKPIPINL